MKVFWKPAFILVLISLSILMLAGCESSTVARFIISEQQYSELSDLENAEQPKQLTAGKAIYASVYFIESPRGMEYTAKWFINENEVKTDTQELLTDRKGIIVFPLEGDKAAAGKLKFQILYEDHALASRELVIAEG